MNYQEYLDFAQKIARQAGQIIKDNFQPVGQVVYDTKSDASPVTKTDFAINALVKRGIEENFPTHRLLGEEDSTEDQNSDYVWVCDPLDGTIPFTRGWPTSMFSLALCLKGVPIVGVVYDPYFDRLFSATHGNGSEVNGLPLKILAKPLESSLIGFCQWKVARYNISEIYPELLHRTNQIVNFASTVYAGAMVATGGLDAILYSGGDPWDIAALKIIIEEAGGVVTDLEGNDQDYTKPVRGAVMSHASVHDKLLDLVKTISPIS